ncbi:ABC transporter substrate-binding protein [Enterovirga rhinocerotis]|uniref:Spermidine/putrescine-binding protein n=1 Tax=Enterovirga rhinocerotis TaxID=1339210 RepID=A0A4R7BWI6_9HYPH|nr:extracellular solute-binding protein [Enterovirga rhinocerotis]TDR90240.1 spermidine/putrescine-binding protein [Enterovirga rhinocerotis]
MSRHPFDLSRRAIMQGSGALLSASALPFGAWAQTPEVTALMVNAMLGPTLKPIAEAEAKVKITEGAFMSGTDTVSRLTAPGGARYDLMNSSFAFSQPVVMGAKAGQERVQPIDVSLIPNMKDINAPSKEGIGERDGKVYMIPHSWGFDSILYNRAVVPDDDPYTQSWSLLFEDKYAGRIGWWDVAHQMLMAAGLYLGHAEPEKMTRSDLNEVGRFLIAKKKNVRTFYTTFAQGSNLLSSNEIDICYGIAPMRNDLQKRGFNITGAWPKEGVLSLISASYIPKDCKNVAGAHAIINAMLGEAYSKELSNGSGYLSASIHGDANLSADEKKKFGYGLFDGSVKHYQLKFPTAMNMWIETWSRVKSS